MLYTDILYLPLSMLKDAPIDRHSFLIIGTILLHDRLETLLVNIHITEHIKKGLTIESGNQNPHIEEEQSTQLQKEQVQMDRKRIYKAYT